MKKLLFIALLIPGLVHAQCAPINLYADSKSPLHKMPVLDQDGTGLCYAYAAAQLLDFAAIKEGKPRSHHPLWLAIKHAEKHVQKGMYSGDGGEAINAIREFKNCPYEQVNKALIRWTKKANSTEAGLIHLIETYAKNFNTKKDNPWLESIKVALPWCGANSTLGEIATDVKKIEDASSIKMFSALLKETCSEKALKPSPCSGKIEIVGISEIVPRVSSQLLSTSSPVGVGLCANVFTNPSYESGYTKSGTRYLYSNCARHEVIVVSQRSQNNQCEFLVRNSWGSSFTDATKNWECVCRDRKTGVIVNNCRNETHGNDKFTVEACWIGERPFEKNFYKIISLKKI